MAVLLDTNILVRLANTADVSYATAARAVAELHRRGEVLHLTPQNLIEFRNVATRPQVVNGLGLTTIEVEAKTAGFEAAFPLLLETPEIYPAWKTLVEILGVKGKQVHDARLMAVCHVYAITHLLTFNVGHFARLAATAPSIIVLDPANV